MGVITRGNFALDLWPGINKHFGDEYKQHPIEYTRIFEKETTDQAFVRDVGVTGFGLAAQVGEGQGVHYDTAQQGFVKDYTIVDYGLGFIITRNMVDDDQYRRPAKNRARALAFSMRQTKEILGANVLNRAFDSNYTGADGLEPCSEVHLNAGGAGGTYANEPDNGLDLSNDALEQMWIDIAGWTDDRGNKISAQPRRLIIPPALKFEADRILKTVQEPGTANNDINAVRAAGVIPEGAFVNHFLTDSDAWFVITNIPNGLKYIERMGDTFSTDNDFDTDNAKFKAIFRCAFGWTNPKGIYGSPGA